MIYAAAHIAVGFVAGAAAFLIGAAGFILWAVREFVKSDTLSQEDESLRQSLAERARRGASSNEICISHNPEIANG